ncbi:hypothetical protein E2C01_058426 [Portunus trituberculatus]|uniref:Uncharacterized protein n=1 Tax=Portunus trituberculatus TaxID=210409 RepID=A0A5B7H632_PORTR|nr:hypothetical protein [Portunus trituberculatus]
MMTKIRRDPIRTISLSRVYASKGMETSVPRILIEDMKSQREEEREGQAKNHPRWSEEMAVVSSR